MCDTPSTLRIRVDVDLFVVEVSCYRISKYCKGIHLLDFPTSYIKSTNYDYVDLCYFGDEYFVPLVLLPLNLRPRSEKG